MKTKTILISVFFFLSLIILSTSYGQKKLEWKGKVKIEEGVKVIINPKEPLFGEIEFELEEDLNIGSEDFENYFFYKIRDIQVDEDENIYVLDSGNHRLQIFDKKGIYLRTIGKKGQGPGEFITPSRLQLSDDTENIYITDMSRTVKIFDREGRYINKDIHLSELLEDFYLDSKRCTWGKFMLPSVDVVHSIKKLTPVGETEKIIAEIPYHIKRKKLSRTTVGNTTKTVGIFFTHGYEYDLFIAKVDSHTLVYGYSKDYELIVLDEAGSTLFIIKKEETPKKISNKEKERIKNQIKADIAKRGGTVPDISIEFPEYKPYFYSIITDNKGRIYVLRNPIFRESNIKHEYDVFNKEGLYLYKADLNYYPDVIRNGNIYTRIVKEETGVEQIKRCKIKNWDQIRNN